MAMMAVEVTMTFFKQKIKIGPIFRGEDVNDDDKTCSMNAGEE